MTSAALVAGIARADFQGATHMMPFEEDSISYSKTADKSPVAQLQSRLDSGAATLKHQGAHGYLLSVLKELKIPKSSQMLVFSKTSFQRERISPSNPRGIYFGDDVYIGYVAGSDLLEVSAVDPDLGAVFYTLDQRPAAKPKFVRTDQCLECHASSKTMGVPGHVVRSFETDDAGVVDLTTGVSQVNHRTPFAERWGGWYVSGKHGSQVHRGNLIGRNAFERHALEPNYGGNLTNLSQFFNLANYPEPHSDIVALMVLEHQTHMHNYITRLNYAAKVSLAQYGHVNYLKSAITGFLKYLLFTEEAKLTEPIEGASGFASEFSKQGPTDPQGRSLRQFDLRTRLFRFPCSYVIYSDAFEGLPSALKEVIYKRLWDILTEIDETEDFEMLSRADRKAILDILRTTKPSLPAYWLDDTVSAE